MTVFAELANVSRLNLHFRLPQWCIDWHSVEVDTVIQVEYSACKIKTRSKLTFMVFSGSTDNYLDFVTIQTQ